ncbi:MAG: hypothetical protein ACFFB3_11345 [Candidatus Hodarchaeota archaeon]
MISHVEGCLIAALFLISVGVGGAIARGLWGWWHSPKMQRRLTPENPWSTLIWLTLVLRDGLPEYREKARHLMLDIDSSILLSGALTALLMVFQTTEFIDRSKPLIIENAGRVAIYLRFQGERTYLFVAAPQHKFVFASYSRLFIRSYERYQRLFGGLSEND